MTTQEIPELLAGLLAKSSKHLINMPDICHHTSLAIKDICRLPVLEDVCCISTFHFRSIFNILFSHQVIKSLRLVVSYFSHSTFLTTHLTRIRKQLKISRAIEKIGKMGFGTLCLSSMAVDQCIPAIKVLTKNEATRLVCPNCVMVRRQSTNLVISARRHPSLICRGQFCCRHIQ